MLNCTRLDESKWHQGWKARRQENWDILLCEPGSKAFISGWFQNELCDIC